MLDKTLTRRERRRLRPKRQPRIRNVLIMLAIGLAGGAAFRLVANAAPAGFEHEGDLVGLIVAALVMIVAALIAAILTDEE